jgi:release factor glutamine methyltransferase
MKLKALLKYVHDSYSAVGIDQPSIEAELLFCHVFNFSLVDLYLAYDRELNAAEVEHIESLMQRRLGGEPFDYIVGYSEFWGKKYYVNNSVLIPRPETELLVEKALELTQGYSHPVIVDVGTGSGVIAISLALEIPSSTIYAIDISSDALGVANVNAIYHKVNRNITFLQGDLLTVLPEKADIIIANLPYVPSDEIINRKEPLLALNGGDSGLEVVSRFCLQLSDKLNAAGGALIEVGAGQSEKVMAILEAVLPGVATVIYKDLSGIDRLVYAKTPVKYEY